LFAHAGIELCLSTYASHVAGITDVSHCTQPPFFKISCTKMFFIMTFSYTYVMHFDHIHHPHYPLLPSALLPLVPFFFPNSPPPTFTSF
jgi:hypothetical protein